MLKSSAEHVETLKVEPSPLTTNGADGLKGFSEVRSASFSDSSDATKTQAAGKDETSSKRACEQCKRRKVKCDRRKPACIRCSQRNETCHFSNHRRCGFRSGIGSELEARLGRLEELIHSQHNVLSRLLTSQSQAYARAPVTSSLAPTPSPQTDPQPKLLYRETPLSPAYSSRADSELSDVESSLPSESLSGGHSRAVTISRQISNEDPRASSAWLNLVLNDT